MRKGRFFTEGNNGGDYVRLRSGGAGNLVHLEVGHQCAVVVDKIVPVEVITAIFDQAVRNKDALANALRAVGWSKRFTDRLIAQIRAPHELPARQPDRRKAEPCEVVWSNACASALESGKTRAECFACGLPACPACSRVREYYNYGKKRVCFNCMEQHDMPLPQGV